MSQPDLLQQVERQLALHALGDHGQPEVPGQVDDRPHDRQVARVGRHALHEGAVDLDLVHRQPAQVGQRRVAGAEVVDRQPYAEVAQPVQRRQRRGRGRRPRRPR